MNQRDQRRRNRDTVLSLVRGSLGISQVEIAAMSKLQPSTTSSLVRDLKKRGIVESIGKRESGPQGGKKADVLALRADYGTFGGIYLKDDELIFGVVDYGGNIVSRTRLPLAGQAEEEIIAAIVTDITEAAGRYPTYRGTGIAVSSIVDLTGDIRSSLHFDRAIPRIVSRIRTHSPMLPVAVDNDANCAADWVRFLPDVTVRNFVHLQVQTSPVTIGAGIVIDGELYRGTKGGAGELLLPEVASEENALLLRIERAARFVAALLDTEAVFVTGELDSDTVAELSARSNEIERNSGVSVRVLDNPDLPLLGAALQAVRLHMNGIQWE